ncbi:MAG: hypothetical protein JSS81_01770 [Acidobacteria bacterium]|nr:hypothetical protein [Acidobacteriota bacterium]
MPNSGLAEIYFIAGMMVVILIVCSVTVYFFFKTYKKEMREREKQKTEAKRKTPDGEK